MWLGRSHPAPTRNSVTLLNVNHSMSPARVRVLTLVAMIAFAGNSLLCRLALKGTGIDPASFTSIRIISGAVCLWFITQVRGGAHGASGSWLSAFALFVYAAAFSFAYVSLTAGTGALLLFGAVQVTMIGYGFWNGERIRGPQAIGFLLAFGGLLGLLLRGISAPPLQGSALMLGAGVAWGVYSLRGRSSGDATRATAGNFLRAVPFVAVLSAATLPSVSLNGTGMLYAVLSGVLASGLGYVIWYTALQGLSASSAATVQLSVPVLAAAGGIIFLGEQLSARLFIAATAILGGIALTILGERKSS